MNVSIIIASIYLAVAYRRVYRGFSLRRPHGFDFRKQVSVWENLAPWFVMFIASGFLL
jgi:hypothetical protein